ncbi:hypothetical protein [Microbacterium sp. G2-8]|uniref:hypothetical protein n=1 Tax=Microbacterium sp. G2-8 TaxID=2842454 RepID=UPI001C8A70A0|nr:hypothetical protein [Microbacterium sp. G2-8]
MTQTVPLSRTAGAAPWELTVNEAQSVADLLDAIGTVEKMKSAMDAFLAFAYAEVQEIASTQAARARADTNDDDFAYWSMAAEIAVATNVSPNAAAKALADIGMRLSSQDVRGRYERLVLEHAATETVFHTRRIAKVIAAKPEPEALEERPDEHRESRGALPRASPPEAPDAVEGDAALTGVYEWTSPAGQQARTEPRSRVRFQDIPATPSPPPPSRSRHVTTGGGGPWRELTPRHENGF